MYRSALVSSLLTAAVLLTACSGEDGTSSAAGDRSTASAETTQPTQPTEASEPTETAEPTVADAADEPTGGPGAEGGGSTPAPAPVTDQPSTPAAPVWPDEVVPVHGSQVWAVYLAVGDHTYNGDVHTLAVTADHVEALGYTGSGIGEVACDQGAAEQLGLDPTHHRVAVYFGSAADAEQFVAVYDRQEVGTAPVTTYCLD